MIFTLSVGCLFCGSLLVLLLAIYLFCRIKFELADLETRLLARNIELKASIKEQIRGGIDFHIRELAQKQAGRPLKRVVR